MGGLNILLRILLSLSVFVAGFGHAVTVEAMGLAGAVPMSHPHCEGHAARAMHDGLHDPAHLVAGAHHAKGGCCKSGSCPCPQVAPVAWEGAGPVSSLGRHASDFAPLRSDYRSPALERLIRPPIA